MLISWNIRLPLTPDIFFTWLLDTFKHDRYVMAAAEVWCNSVNPQVSSQETWAFGQNSLAKYSLLQLKVILHMGYHLTLNPQKLPRFLQFSAADECFTCTDRTSQCVQGMLCSLFSRGGI